MKRLNSKEQKYGSELQNTIRIFETVFHFLYHISEISFISLIPRPAIP